MFVIQTHNFLSPVTLRKKLQAETRIPFDGAEIYKVYKKINTAHYSFISIRQAGEEQTTTNDLHHCFENIRTISGTQSVSRRHNHLYVINPYYLDTRHYDHYIRMWDESAAHMENKPGFVRARLFRTLNEHDKIKLVSIAEWESEEAFLSRFDSAAFREIIAPYENIFAITFNRKMASSL